MPSFPTESDRPHTEASADDEVKAAETEGEPQPKGEIENMASISNLRGIDHLLKMEELISNGCVTIHQLTKTDMILLEAMNPLVMPASIKEKIMGINPTVTMRIAAAEQWPLRVMEVRGDLFKAPRNAVLIHACNTKGLWGKGIAAEFRERYPGAYGIYRQFCNDCLQDPAYKEIPPTQEQETQGPNGNIKPAVVQKPEGECLLIPPQVIDTERTGCCHWIACLFTKAAPGRSGVQDRILENTKLAVEDMKRQVETARNIDYTVLPPIHHGVPGELWSCRLNSGLFAVDWRYTREVLKRADIDVIVAQP